MPSDWIEYTIEQIAARRPFATQIGPFGSKVKAANYVPSGVPYLRGANVNRGRFHDEDFVFVTEAFAATLRPFACEPDDIILVHRGTLGEIGIVPHERKYRWYVLGNSMLKISCDVAAVNPKFVFYWLRSSLGQAQLLSNVSQTGVPAIASPLRTIRNLRLYVPPLEEQNAIAEMLDSIDRKIELNRKMNRTLEQMAQAIFKSWIDCHDSRKEVTVEELIAQGVLVVGDGYRAKRNELADDGLPFARAGNIDNGFHFVKAERLGWDGVKRAGEKVSQTYDVVFTSKGTVGRFAFVSAGTPRFVYSPQLCFWRSVEHARLSPQVLFLWMKSEGFLEQVAMVKGQTDMAEYVSLRDQRKMKLPAFVQGAQSELTGVLAPIQGRIALNTGESETLASLRDLLLPKLVSGEIRIAEAEKAVESAL